MTLAERLFVLEDSAIPALVFDADHFRFRWANTSALEIWGATEKDEFLARDFSDMSVSARTRMQGYLVGFREGRSAQEDWTLYPHGKPLLLRLFFSGIALDDGRTAAFIQAVPRESVDADLVRSVEALRHTSVAVTLLDSTGALLLENPASVRAFGPRTPFADRFVEATVAEALLLETAAGETFHAEVRVRTVEGERWHAVEGRGLIDPATGASAILVHETDETERRGEVQLAVPCPPPRRVTTETQLNEPPTLAHVVFAAHLRPRDIIAPSSSARAGAVYVKSNPGLRAHAIGGASVGSPR